MSGARYELVWATAWEDRANLILAPALGLPSLPVVRSRLTALQLRVEPEGA